MADRLAYAIYFPTRAARLRAIEAFWHVPFPRTGVAYPGIKSGVMLVTPAHIKALEERNIP